MLVIVRQLFCLFKDKDESHWCARMWCPKHNKEFEDNHSTDGNVSWGGDEAGRDVHRDRMDNQKEFLSATS